MKQDPGFERNSGKVWIVFLLLVSCISCMPRQSKISEGGKGEEEMLLIPAGEFISGSDKQNLQYTESLSAAPERLVYLEAFLISRLETTNIGYSKFINSGGYTNKAFWSEEGWHFIQTSKVTSPNGWENGFTVQSFPMHPVGGISWFEADAYARQKGMRLPLEDEWEKAARGNDGRDYPWGSLFSKYKCNVREMGIGGLLPTGILTEGKSPYGVMDMCGNIEEWTTEISAESKNLGKTGYIMKGGSWAGRSEGAMSWMRYRFAPHMREILFGIRLTKDAA